MKQFVKRLMRSGSRSVVASFADSDAWENSLVLQGAQAAFALRGLKSVRCLADVEFKVFSQFGEDGIIEWLVSRLHNIPNAFIEFGVEDYSEANTRFLLRHRNWRGLILDGSTTHMQRVRSRSNYWRNDLTAVAAFIDRDNINGLIADNGFGGDVGLLSIDIDGNDYWVWQAITAVNPWIVIIEYNAVFGDLRPLAVPYDPTFHRPKAHASNLYWGANIRAMEHLGKTRGYSLLGTNRAGNNAFFLRTDLVAQLNGDPADCCVYPSAWREPATAVGRATYVSGADRRGVIADMPVIDVSTGTSLKLGAAGELYSPEWLKIMGESRA